MTTETTVSKGQEFFSPGQTEGDTGGTLIGSAAVSLLLLTQPRRTSCAIWTGNVLVMKVKRKTVRDTNKRKKEQGVLETNCFHVSLWRRHPALPYTTIPTVYWEAHREQANIATLTGTTSAHFLWQLFHLKRWIARSECQWQILRAEGEEYELLILSNVPKAWGRSIHEEIQQRRWNLESESSVCGSSECFLIWLFF